MCWQKHDDSSLMENRIPFPKPDRYDPKQYELLLRIYEAGWRGMHVEPVPPAVTSGRSLWYGQVWMSHASP